MRKYMLLTAVLAVAACSNSSSKSNAPTLVSPMGQTQAIVTDGANHVAYLLNASPGFGTPGDLHLAGTNGKDDLKIASGISVGGYIFSADGKGMLFTAANPSQKDASLSWVDMSNPTAPKSVFSGGLQMSGTMPNFAAPLLQQGFVSPSGRFYILGVLAPMINVSPDLHVIDMDSGTDVFQRANGAFDYLELVLPNDVMVFQDAVGGNGGVAGGAGLQTLFWVDLTSGSPTATTIDTRTGAYQPTGDNKTIIYQNADTRELFTWDAVAKPATGTKVASGALNFAAGTSGPIAYVGTDGSMHIVGLDGTPVVDVAAATAKADPFSPVYISADGADAYYFQAVATQDGQGTLMHLAATAGATPAKIVDSASLTDVHPLPDGVLLYLANVDATGVTGDAFKSARDGSGATALGTKVPVGFLAVSRPTDTTSSTWVSAHLINSSEDMNQKLADAIRAITGGLELTTASATTMIDPMARLGQFQISDDFASLVYVSGSTFDISVDNYVGNLEEVPVAMPTMKPAKPILTGVTEVGSVVKKSLFVNAPKASKPGVYFVSF